MERQWVLLESQMTAVELDLLQQIKIAARNYLPHIHELGSRRQLNNSLGQMELNMSKAYAFFDTYMDVLTQRHTPELGALLAGCDVLHGMPCARSTPPWRSLNLRWCTVIGDSAPQFFGKVFLSPT
jgi:hypothetical protein